MSIYDKASLVLIPSGTKTSKVYSQVPTNGDGDFTFSRSTAATRVNASGNIEKETQNFFLQSNQFDTTWYSSGVSRTSGQSGYDGTNDAWLISRGGPYNYMAQNITTSGVQSYSIYAKAGTLDWIYIDTQNSALVYSGAFFNLSSGSVGSIGSGIIDTKIEAAGNGYYRCTIVFNESLNRVLIYPVPSDGGIGEVGSGSIYIQDAQLEQGLVARDYIETTTTAIYGGITDNVPRLDYTDSSCPALLLEPQRTNNIAHSEYLVGISAVNAATSANEAISPEGVNNATKLSALIAAPSSQWARYYNIVQTNQKQALSIYAKAGNIDDFTITYYDMSTGDLFFNYDLGAGSVSAPTGSPYYVDADIQDMGNGWYRCIAIVNAQASGTNAQFQVSAGIQRVAQNIGDYVYIYGYQWEQEASYATSYIPTYGSAVTRNKEICEVTNAADIIGQTGGTIAGEFTFDSKENTNRLFSVSGADWNTIGSIRFDIISLKPQATIRANGGEPAKIIGTQDINVGSLVKFAVVYTSTTLKMFVNGAQVGSTTTLSGSLPSLIDEVRINALGGNFISDTQNNQLNPYKQALVFKTALTDQEAIDLTTI